MVVGCLANRVGAVGADPLANFPGCLSEGCLGRRCGQWLGQGCESPDRGKGGVWENERKMMTLMDLPPHYSGVARLFPVRNSVLFPAVLQSVQVVRPAGIRMIEHALTGDRLIAFATQWSPDTPRPVEPLYRMICLARIVEYDQNDEGFELSVLGIRRAWIRREVPTQNPFRMADVQVLEPDPLDSLLPLEVEQRTDLATDERDQIYQRLQVVEHWKRQLKNVLRQPLAPLLTTALSMQQLLDSRKSLDTLTDLVTHLMRIPVGLKLKQLQTLDPVVRAQRLVALFGHLYYRIGTDGFQLSGAEPSSVGSGPSKTEAGNSLPVTIDYQSAEFEVVVQNLVDQADDAASRSWFSGHKPMLLDKSMQEFPDSSEHQALPETGLEDLSESEDLSERSDPGSEPPSDNQPGKSD